MICTALCLLISPQINVVGVRDGLLVAGDAPQIILKGFPANSKVTVYGQRTMEKYVNTNGTWGPVAVPVVSWAEFRSNSRGEVDVDRSKPLRGSWRRSDPLGILYSMIPKGHSQFKEAPLPAFAAIGGDIRITVVGEGTAPVSRDFVLTEFDPEIKFGDVRRPELNGAFAVPKAAKKPLPLIVYLHGSEGSNPADARVAAIRFAKAGYACFSLSYRANPWLPIPGVPTDAVNVPIEVIERVRTWARSRPEVDSSRIGLYGVSKGAEMVLVSGIKFPWVKALVSCVGTDSVWEGYGREKKPDEVFSSWSWQGKPLPYIPYLPSKEFFAKPGARATDWHLQSRREAGRAAVMAARLPVEGITSPLLLLAGEKDEVWPSAPMSRSVARSMNLAGKGHLVTLRVYKNANHQISGPGAWPTTLYAADPLGPKDANPIDVGEATVDAWRETLKFFAQYLRIPAKARSLISRSGVLENP